MRLRVKNLQNLTNHIVYVDFLLSCYREVVLGELRIDTDPDCTNNGRSCAPRKITREIKTDDQIIVHENYQPGSQTQANDIALIRLNEPVPLYDDDPKRYIMG